MSINQGERFSNERYLTMTQVSKTLGTTLIDDIWKEVLTYRSAFMSQLSLRTVERNRLRIVLTPKINDRITQLDRRLSRIQMRLNEFMVQDEQKLHIKTLLYKDILKTVASTYDITFNEAIVAQLINGSASVLTPREMFLHDYFRGLELLQTSKERVFDETLLADIGRLFNMPPLSNYIYRTTEVKSARHVAVINNIQNHVLVNQIVDAINDFYAFFKNSRSSGNLPTIAMAAVILFFFDYIKPFEVHSELIAIILAKSYLAQNELELLAPYLNFELLLEKYNEAREDIFSEVKKSSDITYFLDLFMNVVNESLEIIEERIAYVATHELIAEKHELDEEIGDDLPLANDLFTHARQEQISARKPTPVFSPKPGAVQLPVAEEKEGMITPTEANLGVSELPLSLSENDILRLERHLREIDPSLSRASAYFYARHCTIGKYYTINDFKEVTGCAYETARTSMDHLAYSGYYRKEKFKNKFLYTPMKKE